VPEYMTGYPVEDHCPFAYEEFPYNMAGSRDYGSSVSIQRRPLDGWT
jgi:hypothetical protein